MIHLEKVTVGQETLNFLIAAPDWGQGMRMTYSMGTVVTESVTGGEHRRRQRLVPRLSLTYEAVLTGADAQRLRGFLGSMDATRTIMPLWPDLMETGDWDNRVHDAQLSAGWNGGDDFQTVQINTSSGVPAGSSKSPCLVGRLERPELTALTDDLCQTELTLIEDGDYPVSLSGPPPETWDKGGWGPNWVSPPAEVTRDLLDYESLGRGRRKQVQGTAAIRYQQTARFTLERDSLKTLLAFWQAKAGSYKAFDAPAWFSPTGVGSPYGPDQFSQPLGTGQARFSGDLAVQWLSPGLAEIEIILEQVFDDDDSGPRPAFAFLYKIERGSIAQRLTEWEDEVSTTDGIYTPARIEHSGLKSTLGPSQDSARLKVSLDDCPILLKLAQGEHEESVKVTIYEASLSANPIVPRVLFLARVRRPAFVQNVMDCELSWLGGLLNRSMPAFNLSITCNYPFLSAGCTRRRPTEMTRAKWQSSGTIHPHGSAANAVILRNVSTPVLPLGASIQSGANDYFLGGWFECGQGIDKQSRLIIQSTWSGADLILSLARPLIWAVLSEGGAGLVIPGCSGAYAACRDKFANDESFGGCPQMPSFFFVQNAGSRAGAGK